MSSCAVARAGQQLGAILRGDLADRIDQEEPTAGDSECTPNPNEPRALARAVPREGDDAGTCKVESATPTNADDPPGDPIEAGDE